MGDVYVARAAERSDTTPIGWLAVEDVVWAALIVCGMRQSVVQPQCVFPGVAPKGHWPGHSRHEGAGDLDDRAVASLDDSCVALGSRCDALQVYGFALRELPVHVLLAEYRSFTVGAHREVSRERTNYM